MTNQPQQPFIDAMRKAALEVYRTRVEPTLAEILKELGFKIVNDDIDIINQVDEYICLVTVHTLKPELPPDFSAKLKLEFIFHEDPPDSAGSDLHIDAVYTDSKQGTYYDRCQLYDFYQRKDNNYVWYNAEHLRNRLTSFLNDIISKNRPDIIQKRRAVRNEITKLDELLIDITNKKKKLKEDLQKLKRIENKETTTTQTIAGK